MKIARKHIISAIELHDEIMARQDIPVSRQYVTVRWFKKYKLTVKRYKNGWRVLWYKRKRGQ